jgi:hypothetical protein
LTALLVLTLAPVAGSSQQHIARSVECDVCQDFDLGGGEIWHYFKMHQFPPPYANYDATYAHSDTTAGRCAVWHDPCYAAVDARARAALAAGRMGGLQRDAAEALVATYPGAFRYADDRSILLRFGCQGGIVATYLVHRLYAASDPTPRSPFVLDRW